MEMESCVGILVALLTSLAWMPVTASEETENCGDVTGDESEAGPDTCTVQLTLNDTDADTISSLKFKYQDFPHRCRLGKAHSSVCNSSLV